MGKCQLFMYDYIIVGAGSVGCVLANRLTDPNTTLLLLEVGPVDTKPEIHMPNGFIYLQRCLTGNLKVSHKKTFVLHTH